MRRLPGLAPVPVLFLLAPLTAESLIGYDDTTGRPAALLLGLLFFGPLYGGPALLVRETARRAGRGWPTVVLLATAFGLFQAGLVDQSLFNDSYREIDDWDDLREPTLIPAFGTSAYLAVNFVAGHVIWSICAPIAVVETLVPRRRTEPWLGAFGLTVVALSYALVSALIFYDHVETQHFLAAPAQMIGTGLGVAALGGAAFAVGRRPRPSSGRPAPGPWRVGAAALAAALLYNLVPANWAGVAVMAALLAGAAVAVAVLSRRGGWGAAHRLALAGGALLAYAGLAFTVTPLGDPPVAAKLAHNAAFAVGVVVLLAAAGRASGSSGSRTGSGTGSDGPVRP